MLYGNLEYYLSSASPGRSPCFVSLVLFSTMPIEEMVDSLHGLPLPNIVGFTSGYAFLPTYTSVSDICRTAEGLKVSPP